MVQRGRERLRRALTVVVSDELVEVNLGIDLLAASLVETSPEDVSVINTDVLGRGVEVHRV